MKKYLLIFIIFFLFTTNIYAATRDVVPRADSEGSIGTSDKRWNNSYFDEVNSGTYRDSADGLLIRSSDSSISITEDADGSYNLTSSGSGSGSGTVNVYRDSFSTTELNSGYGLRVTHNLGQKYVTVTISDGDDLMLIPSDIEFIDSNNLDLTLSDNLSVSGTHNITVTG